MGRRFDQPELLAKPFDDPARDAWQKPNIVFAALQLKNNQVLADVEPEREAPSDADD